MGDIVSVRVLRRLSGARWSVAIGGKLFAATSETNLEPGSAVHGRVLRRGDRVVLRLTDGGSGPIQRALSDAGIKFDPLAEAIVLSLFRSGLPFRPEHFRKLRVWLRKVPGNENRAVRALSVLMSKGIDVLSAGVDGLMGVIGFGERGADDRRRYHQERFSDARSLLAALRRIASGGTGQQGNALQVFNHLQRRNETWVVIPYNLAGSEKNLYGTIRLLYDLSNNTVGRVVLLVHSDAGTRWSFHIKVTSTRRTISMFSNQGQLARGASARLKALTLKLQNLGLEVDDTIHDDCYFDGFTPTFEDLQFKRVDTAG